MQPDDDDYEDEVEDEDEDEDEDDVDDQFYEEEVIRGLIPATKEYTTNQSGTGDGDKNEASVANSDDDDDDDDWPYATAVFVAYVNSDLSKTPAVNDADGAKIIKSGAGESDKEVAVNNDDDEPNVTSVSRGT